MSDHKARIECKKAELEAIRERLRNLKIEKEKDEEKPTSKLLEEISLPNVPGYPATESAIVTFTPGSSISSTPEVSLQPNVKINYTRKKKVCHLSIVTGQSTDIFPAPTLLYTKQTQTVAHNQKGDSWNHRQSKDEDESLPFLGRFTSKLPPGNLPHGFPQVKEVKPALTTVEQQKAQQEIKETCRLSEEEKDAIITSESFQKFICRASKLAEGALTENVNIFIDYTSSTEVNEASDKSSKQILLKRHFYDDKWSENRCITSLDWCSQHPELLLASYNYNECFPNDPDGVALIWNTRFKKTTPEFIFHCHSGIMSATFAQFNPNLVLGGTYSGQIVLWDNRASKRTPINRSALSTAAHTQPIYCIRALGIQDAHTLVSISTDGRMCTWSLDMLTRPQDTLDLHIMQAKYVAVTCLVFPYSDTNNLIVGTEDGAAYCAQRLGAKKGITHIYNEHEGPITGVSINKVQGPADFSHLFLTSSVDWTVKLWSVKDSTSIYSFQNRDYVTDIDWSSINPALFASVDSSGHLDLWNLNQDTEFSSASIMVEGKPALNKVLWAPSGLHIMVGDNQGRIWVYETAESFAYPKHYEWENFLNSIAEMKII